MLEKLKYINHINETLELGQGPLFVNENDLRNFAWEVTSKNDKISSFRKGIVSKTIPVILKCDSMSEGVELRNRIFEVFEKDVLAQQHGKIVIGDYYLKCYVTGSQKSDYLINKGYMQLNLTVQTDYPQWVKETTHVFSANSESTEDFLDYPHDFPHDFKNELVNTEINNTAFVATNFIITIFGSVSNPALYIADHEYSVDVDIEEGDFLTINSIDKTIVLSKNNGSQVNCFNKRNKDSYIFEKIPAGISTITSTNPQIFFNITLLEERSEPKWT